MLITSPLKESQSSAVHGKSSLLALFVCISYNYLVYIAHNFGPPAKAAFLAGNTQRVFKPS